MTYHTDTSSARAFVPNGAVTKPRPFAGLSPQERALFDILAAQPMTVQDLACALYGDDPDGGPLCAELTVRVRICQMRPKLVRRGWDIPRLRRRGGDRHYRLVRLS